MPKPKAGVRTARKRFLMRTAFASALALAVFSCSTGESQDGPENLGCADLSARTFGDSAGEDHYRVIAPNGGEAFHVGDSLTVAMTSGASDSEAVLELAVFRDGKSAFVAVPGTPRTRIDPRSQCRWKFLIPDSLGAVGRQVSMVSDSLKVRVSKYNQSGLVYDYSDAFFRILPANQ
jgi:hypothetical protein